MYLAFFFFCTLDRFHDAAQASNAWSGLQYGPSTDATSGGGGGGGGGAVGESSESMRTVTQLVDNANRRFQQLEKLLEDSQAENGRMRQCIIGLASVVADPPALASLDIAICAPFLT